MESYIPHTFSNTKAKKPWFNSACSYAVKDREETQKRYHSHPSAETHAFLYAHNHAKSILQLAKNSFINRKCQNLSNANSSRDFWHLANSISNNSISSSFPPLLQLQLSLFSKAELFTQTCATNSTLDDTGHIPPLPSDYFILKIRIVHYDVFHTLSGLDSWKAYGLDGVPPVVLKTCVSELTPCLIKLFCLCLSTSTYPSCWKFAHIQPVPKKSDCSNPSNYRLSKAFESVLNMNLHNLHNLLSDCQYGFWN